VALVGHALRKGEQLGRRRARFDCRGPRERVADQLCGVVDEDMGYRPDRLYLFASRLGGAIVMGPVSQALASSTVAK